jgi:hypothetical protein
MNAPEQKSLGGFEQRLLRELRQVVAVNPKAAVSVPEAPARSSVFGRRLRIGLAATAATATAIAVASAISIGGGEGSTAWAVSPNPDGTVTVEIKSLSDAAGLQQKLDEAGIRSLVQYLPPGKTCAGGELTPQAPGAVTQTNGDPSAPPLAAAKGKPDGISTEGGHGADAGPATQSSGAPLSGDHPRTSGPLGVKVATSADGSVQFTVIPTQHSDETLVIRSQGSAPSQAKGQSEGLSALSVSEIQGQAQPCPVVDSPAQ